MHYNITYLPGPADDLRALNDIRDYLGDFRWAKFWQNLTSHLSPDFRWANLPYSAKREWRAAIILALDFVGVRGRPARAYVRAFIRAYS
jgi:hypothetical protein